MLATFVIGLREGLEAALIVGIVAAFLKQRGGQSAMRWVWIGVGSALLICLAVGIALQIVSQNLPQRQQEALETVIGAVAVVMVTYMVIWMRRHSRDLKGQLEGVAGAALAQGSARALIAMAFLAVLREGLETAVFLVAAFNASNNAATSGSGALLGVLLASALGYGIYRGGVKINLSKFFRATGLVLVLVAAGLVMTGLHTAHEAGWLNSGQDQLFDASAVVRNGSVQAALITGVLGLQPRPTVIEGIGWLLYLVPVGLYVAWPPGKRVAWRPIAWVAATLSLACVAAAIAFAAAAPAQPPAADQATWKAAATGTVSGNPSGSAAADQPRVVRGETTWTAAGAKFVVAEVHDDVDTSRLSSQRTTAITGDGLPATVTLDQLRTLGGGRLPIGLQAADVKGAIPLTYRQQITDTVWQSPTTGVLLDANRRAVVTATAELPTGVFVIGTVRETVTLPTAAARAAAVTDDAAVRQTLDKAERWGTDFPALFGTAAGMLAIVSVIGVVSLRRRREAPAVPTTAPAGADSSPDRPTAGAASDTPQDAERVAARASAR